MLRDILREMSRGEARTSADLATRLGVSEGFLSQMMEDLARRGYLASRQMASGCDGCSGCDTSRTSNGCALSEATASKTWVLTTKGSEAAKHYRQ